MMTARVCASCAAISGARQGPVEGVAADPRYLDVFVPPGKRKTLKVEVERHAFAYVFEGDGQFAYASQAIWRAEREADRRPRKFCCASRSATARSCCSIRGDEVTVQAGEKGIRFLLVSGKPIEEPVAWHGPIVMNTQAELRQAVTELQNGTFIRN